MDLDLVPFLVFWWTAILISIVNVQVHEINWTSLKFKISALWRTKLENYEMSHRYGEKKLGLCMSSKTYKEFLKTNNKKTYHLLIKYDKRTLWKEIQTTNEYIKRFLCQMLLGNSKLKQ